MRAANFVEETTTSIAGTGGNGAVTLTAVTGRPRFSTVFGTQATTIRYVIEDTTSGKFETGVGVVSANVLTRTRPQVTWDGTTYDDSTPSPLAFGSTPASGNVRVRMAATAESQAPVFGGVQSVASGDSWKDYPFSSHFIQNNGNGNALDAVVADREYYLPHRFEQAGLITGIQAEVTAAIAASNYKLALYSCGHDGLPSRKIVDFATQSGATTGVKADTATGSWSPAQPVWITPGWYYVGFIASAAITMRGTGSSSINNMPSPLGRKDGYGYGSKLYIAGSYASGLPQSPSLSGAVLAGNAGGQSGVWWIGFKVEA